MNSSKMCNLSSDAASSHTLSCPQHSLIGNKPQLKANEQYNYLNLQSN